MLLLDTISQFVAMEPSRYAGAAAEICHRNALEHCAEGDLLRALAFSRAAKRFEELEENMRGIAAIAKAAPPSVAEMEREFCKVHEQVLLCIPCGSYHATPRDFGHWQELQCRRPWDEWTRACTPEEIKEWRDDAARAREDRTISSFIGTPELMAQRVAQGNAINAEKEKQPPLTLADLKHGQTVTARPGRAGRDSAEFGPWRQTKLYLVRREKPLPASLRRRSDSANVGDIITLAADGCECEFSQSDYQGEGVFMAEEYYLEIQGLK